jgi:hypothetical protein
VTILESEQAAPEKITWDRGKDELEGRKTGKPGEDE